MTPRVRAARDEDADGLIELIASCWSEYPGCILDVDGEVPELRGIASHYGTHGGRFWVAEADGSVVASVGLLPRAPSLVELCKLYVDRRARRCGLGTQLVSLVEQDARCRGAAFLELWSDTRFLDAHRLYRRLGFSRQPETRSLDDLSHSVEFHFCKRLIP